MNDEYDDIFEEQDDATELAEDEKEGLIPSYISTRGELNQAEQQNIVQGELWAFAKKRNPLDMRFLDTLHKKMYGAVWEWAGSYRKTARNIGIDAYRIPMELKQLIDDTQDMSAEDVICSVDPFCYVSHLSAMQLYGLTNRRPEALHLTIPDQKHLRQKIKEKMELDYGEKLDILPEECIHKLNAVHHPHIVRKRKLNIHQSR